MTLMATDKDRLKKLLELDGWHLGAFGVLNDGSGRRAGRGNVPTHYKRNTVPEEDRQRLTKLGMVKLFSYFKAIPHYTQALIAGVIFSGEYQKIGIITSSQYGKLLADDTPVLTRNGWKNHGDLVVGDDVISPDGKFVKVTHVHPKGVANRVVTFRNGDQIVCHENHEWVVYDKNSHAERTMETKAIEKRGPLRSAGGSKFTVRAIEPLQGEHKSLAVDPYVLGVWLGDGATTKSQITEGADDIAVLEKVREVYPDGSTWVHKDTGVPTWSFKGLMQDLRKYGMCFTNRPDITKRIPEEYLTASLEQRLQLLAGLIDTDGYRFEDDGRFYFTTTSEKLRDDVETLISTFGWRFSTVKADPVVSTSGIHGKKPVYNIGFNPSFDIPCVLERKRPTRFAKQRGLGIYDISSCEPVRGNCITVEGGVYCVGRHLIPTHNSILMGWVALAYAYMGHKTNIAAATSDKTEIIMRYCMSAAATANIDIKKALTQESLKRVDKLDQSISKTRLSFPGRGSVQGVTLGETFADVSRNKAIGESGAWIVDEAALVSSEAMAEIGRREFSSIDGAVEPLVMISNPHNPGYFYDFITKEEMKPGECVIWCDALTMVQEGRVSKETVLNSEFCEHRETLQKYLLCELPSVGAGMFDEVRVRTSNKGEEGSVSVLGIDAAYKGKDKIKVCRAEIEAEKVYFSEIITIEKKEWIDGATSQDIIRQIGRLSHGLGAALCCVDEGWGVWLKEGLVLYGVNAKGINFNSRPTPERVKAHKYAAMNAVNKRAEMHLDLQDLIEHQACEFAPAVYKEIEEVLPLITSERKTNGIQIVPKPEIAAKLGHSPDAFDAVLLALHAAVLYSQGRVAYNTEVA